MLLVMRSSAAFSRLIESSIGFFSEGTLSARGWRWPTGASPGSNCCPEFVDRCSAVFREPAVCAIATEVSTRASNAIVVINFRMLGFQSGAPHDDGNGKLDHKVQQDSRFVQILQRAGDAGKNLGYRPRPSALRQRDGIRWARFASAGRAARRR